MTVPMEVQIPLQEALVVLLYAAPIQLAGAAAGLIVYLIDTTRQKVWNNNPPNRRRCKRLVN